MQIASFVIDIIAAIATIVPIFIAAVTYKKDTRRKAKQDTIEAYTRLNKDVLFPISNTDKKTVREYAENPRSEGYKKFTTYLMEIESFCIGLENKIYDFGVFYQLANHYFNSEQGVIQPRLMIILEAKKGDGADLFQYHKALGSIWKKMDERDRKTKKAGKDIAK